MSNDLERFRLHRAPQMRNTPGYRLLRLSLFAFLVALIGTIVAFRIQAFLFDREVRSVLTRMEEFQLENTSEETVLKTLPQMKRETPGAVIYARNQIQNECPADACYLFHTGNIPDGWLLKMKYKLGPHFDWFYGNVYRMGHRFCGFDAFVRIRGGRVAKFGYTITIEDADYPGSGLVVVDVSGTNQSSFSRGQGFNLSYEEINNFRVRVASNRPKTSLFVAFTPRRAPKTSQMRLRSISSVCGTSKGVPQRVSCCRRSGEISPNEN